MLDLGNGAVGALQHYTGLYDIDVVCLSHLHPDHCLDLCSYYVARTYAPGGPIPVYGPTATGQRMALAYGQAGHPGMEEAFSFRTLAEGTWQLGPVEVTTARVNHPVETFGFRFRQSGRVLTYSADTGESPTLVLLALTSRAGRAKGRGRAVAHPVAVVLPGTRINDHACTRDRRRRIHRLAYHRCPADQGR